MSEDRRLRIFWVILAILLGGGFLLATKVGALVTVEVTAASVTKLLTTFFVLALLVERTLEVFVSAWRDEDKTHLDNELKSLQAQLEKNPADPSLQLQIAAKTKVLTEYTCDTRAVSLRAGLVLGIL